MYIHLDIARYLASYRRCSLVCTCVFACLYVLNPLCGSASTHVFTCLYMFTAVYVTTPAYVSTCVCVCVNSCANTDRWRSGHARDWGRVQGSMRGERPARAGDAMI